MVMSGKLGTVAPFKLRIKLFMVGLFSAAVR